MTPTKDTPLKRARYQQAVSDVVRQLRDVQARLESLKYPKQLRNGAVQTIAHACIDLEDAQTRLRESLDGTSVE